MNTTNKVLLIFFVVLLIVVAGEGIYYLKTVKKNQQTRTAPAENIATVSPTLAVPSATDLEQIAQESTITKFVSDLEKGYITSAAIVMYYKGKFLSQETITTDRNEIYNGGLKISIQLNIQESDNINNLVIPAATVKIMKVYEKTGDTEKEISIGDLKKGDAVTVRQDYNVVETDPSKGILLFTITKTN